MRRSEWRFILTGKLDGPTNMAIDEFLFLESAKRKYNGNLRFYFWNKPTISLGYFQNLNEIIDLDKCKKLGIDIVRRITGGGAIYHNDEITYSITTFLPNPTISTDIDMSYKILESFLIEGISELGISVKYRDICFNQYDNFYCFANPSKYDIVFNGKKLVGSAQRRSKKSFLQHGSILISINDVDKMFSVFKDFYNKEDLIKEFKEKVTSLEELLKGKININQIIDIFVKKFKEQFDVDLNQYDFTDSEKEMIQKLREKYVVH